MKFLKRFAVATAIAAVALSIQTAGALPLSEENIKLARDKVYPATVRVDTRRSVYKDGQKQWESGSGSGFIIDKEGHVVTNFHVAGEAQEITCVMLNKERVKARLVGGDAWTDLAVLQLDMKEMNEKYPNFITAEIGDSDKIEEGDAVIAVGAPFGLSRTITAGIISCRDRMLGSGMTLPGGQETGLFNTWLQTDAQINPGNSGGPLVNMEGKVIGINTRAVSQGGIGFSLPSNVAKDVIAQIIKNRRVMRSDIGVDLQPLQDVEGLMGSKLTDGVVISSVTPDSVGEASGLKSRDILLSFDGKKIAGRYPEDLFGIRNMIASTPVGKNVEVVVRRDSKDMAISLKTEELTSTKALDVEFKEWGLIVQAVTDRMARKRNFPDSKGMLVSGVRMGLPASRAKVQEGDVIIAINDHPVDDAQTFRKFYNEAMTGANEMVLIKVRRGEAIQALVLKKSGAPAPTPQ